MRPNPELWSRVLPHKTQVVYNSDAAFITGMLDIKNGSVVVEAGSGSGCLSLSLCRTVKGKGKVYTFENNPERYESIKKQILENGLEDTLVASKLDVCIDGFGLENVADSVFIDIPTPWNAIAHVPKMLKQNKATRICVFCPCMEQISMSCAQLRTHGFFDIEIYETQLREFCVKNVAQKSFEFSAENARYTVDPEGFQTNKLTPCSGHRDGTSKAPETPNEVPGRIIRATHEPKNVHGYTAYMGFATYYPVYTHARSVES